MEAQNKDARDAITIDSTDGERTKILSKKKLTIAQWDQSKELLITDPNESTAKALKRDSIEMGLKGKDIHFSEFHSPVTFTQSTLKESITQMSKRGANLTNLGKLMSVLEPVCDNAIKIEVEPYRHVNRRQYDEIKQCHQFLSAFHDGAKAYPVKITINEKGTRKDQFYMVVTVGEIDISAKLKEALTNTGASHQVDERSLSDGGASFTISIPAFVADFKRDESIIIKNLPDGLLNKEQRDIKQRVLEADTQKEVDIKIKLSGTELNQLNEQGFTEEDIETVVRNLDNVTKICSAQLDAVQESLENNRAAIREQAEEIREEARVEAHKNSNHMR